MIEATIDLQTEGETLLEEVCASELFRQDELPTPSDEERRSPQDLPTTAEQPKLLSEE